MQNKSLRKCFNPSACSIPLHHSRICGSFKAKKAKPIDARSKIEGIAVDDVVIAQNSCQPLVLVIFHTCFSTSDEATVPEEKASDEDENQHSNTVESTQDCVDEAVDSVLLI